MPNSTALLSQANGTRGSAVDVFMRIRPRLLAVAYKVLENSDDAEDIVQGAWIRWQLADHDSVLNPTAFLVTVTSRLALNLATSAANRHTAGPLEEYQRSETTTPEDLHERQDEVERCLFALMSSLGPGERAAFLLREVFQVSYGEIAQLIGQSETAVRQTVSRARRKLPHSRPTPVDRREHGRLVRAFRRATRTGDRQMLNEVLVEYRSLKAA